MGIIRKNPSGDIPIIASSAYIDKTAIICGKVIIYENVFVGPYAVIRADELDERGEMLPIIIGQNSNIQDGVVIHSKSGAAVSIGDSTSIAHRSIVHGPCSIGSNVFIGFNSVLFNCTIGDGCMIRYNAVVDGCHIPPNRLIPSCKQITREEDVPGLPESCNNAREFSESVALTNITLAQLYKQMKNEELA